MLPGSRLARQAAVVTLVTTAACSTLKSTFPSHEDVFTPIAPAIGTMRLAGADTSWALTGPGYEVTATNRALLEPAKRELDEAAAAWERYFGGPPPTVAGVVRQYTRERGDRERRAPDSTLATGTPVVFVAIADRRARPGMMPLEDVAIIQPVVRAWARAAIDSGHAARAETQWLRTGVTALVGGMPEPDIVTLQLARDTTRLLPLRDILRGDRPGGPGDETGPAGAARRDQRRDMQRGRRGAVARELPALEGARLWDAQAISFTHYLASREGRPFIGRVAATLAAGAPLDDALASAYSLPHDVASVERAWRQWVGEQGIGSDGRPLDR